MTPQKLREERTPGTAADRKPPAEPLAEPLLDGDPLAWDEVTGRLRSKAPSWLSTRDADGFPRTRPVLAVWLDGVPHLAASPGSRKASNLHGDPRCTLAVSGAGLDVVVEGGAAVIRDGAVLDAVAEAYARDYGWQVEIRDGALWAEGAPTAGPPPYIVWQVEPALAYAFGTDESTMARSTRWVWTARGRG